VETVQCEIYYWILEFLKVFQALKYHEIKRFCLAETVLCEIYYWILEFLKVFQALKYLLLKDFAFYSSHIVAKYNLQCFNYTGN
jgi:hypothetical protein